MVAWIDKLKLTRTKKKAVEELMAELTKAHNDMEPAVRGEDVPRLAIEWGLPIKLASMIETNALIKTVAVAATMAA